MFGLFGKRCKSMTMREGQAELEKDKTITVIDVRETNEFKQGRIKGSVNVPLHLVPVTLAKKVPNKKTRLFVYCLSGARSSQACSWMMNNGYEDVTNIGAIGSWAGPIVKG